MNYRLTTIISLSIKINKFSEYLGLLAQIFHFFEYMIQIVVRSVKDYSENREIWTQKTLEFRKTYSKMKYGRNNVILNSNHFITILDSRVKEDIAS